MGGAPGGEGWADAVFAGEGGGSGLGGRLRRGAPTEDPTVVDEVSCSAGERGWSGSAANGDESSAAAGDAGGRRSGRVDEDGGRGRRGLRRTTMMRRSYSPGFDDGGSRLGFWLDGRDQPMGSQAEENKAATAEDRRW